MSINHASSWKRLEVYHRGDTVNYDGKIWESVADENFNHLPTFLILSIGKNWVLVMMLPVRIGRLPIPDMKIVFISFLLTVSCLKIIEAENHTLNL